MSFRREAALRILADAVLINVALVAAFVVRFLNLLDQLGPVDLRGQILEYVHLYAANACLITVISLIVFSVAGFYTFGRAYRGRYKALVVLRAVCLAYLIYGSFAFGLRSGLALPGLHLTWTGSLTFSLWGLAWIFTSILLVVARLWSLIWMRVKDAERALDIKTRRPVSQVLLIGGGGYIGSALVPMLLEAGYHVRILDRLMYGLEPIAPYLNHPRFQLIEADFRQIDHVVKAVHDADAVVHLGGLVGDPACAVDEELTLEINLMATRMIAEVAKGLHVERFIFASTCSVYGASEEILDERSALNPVSLYARSKIASERVLVSLADRDFAPTCLRFGTIYGISGRTRFDLVVNLLSAKAAVDGEITVFGGDQWRPFLHVEDAALGILKTIQAPLECIRGEVFNVGSNEENYTLSQVGRMVKQQVPDARLTDTPCTSDRRNYRVNFDKMRRLLGFYPAWTVEAGIQQVLGALRKGRIGDYRDPAYSNVGLLNQEGAASSLLRQERTWAQDLIAQPIEEMGFAVASSGRPKTARAARG